MQGLRNLYCKSLIRISLQIDGAFKFIMRYCTLKNEAMLQVTNHVQISSMGEDQEKWLCINLLA